MSTTGTSRAQCCTHRPATALTGQKAPDLGLSSLQALLSAKPSPLWEGSGFHTDTELQPGLGAQPLHSISPELLGKSRMGAVGEVRACNGSCSTTDTRPGTVSAPEKAAAAQGLALGRPGAGREAPCYSHTAGIHSALPSDIETQMVMTPCLMQHQQPGISIFHSHS